MRRKFILGDEWLYYKLYCGRRTADSILVDAIKPLSEKLLKKGWIDQWFFIRYTDPRPHLRVRFHLKRKDDLSFVIEEFNASTRYYLDNDLIWDLQTDTYQRELERYGTNTISESEELFFYDSAACVDALQYIEEDELLFLFGLRSIKDTLTAFGLDNHEKCTLAEWNLKAFKEEFNSDKHLSRQLSKKHQALKDKIELFLTINSHPEYQPLLDLLDKKMEQMRRISKKIAEKAVLNQLSIDSLLSSYVHMMVNRLFRDKQRLYELVCYDCLHKFYNFKIHKNVD